MINEIINNLYLIYKDESADKVVIETIEGNFYELHYYGFDIVNSKAINGLETDEHYNIRGIKIISVASDAYCTLVELSDKRFIEYIIGAIDGYSFTVCNQEEYNECKKWAEEGMQILSLETKHSVPSSGKY